MTNDKRLEQETCAGAGNTARPGNHNYLAEQKRADELNDISPIFRRLQVHKPSDPTASQWQAFSKDLQRNLVTQNAPFTRTLRDQIVSSDYNLMRWFWILLALTAMAIAGAALAIYTKAAPLAPALASRGGHTVHSSNLRPVSRAEEVFLSRQVG